MSISGVIRRDAPSIIPLKKVVGKLKHEASGQSLGEFAGLKTKMDSYQTINDPSQGEPSFTIKKRSKGIQRPAVANDRHEE